LATKSVTKVELERSSSSFRGVSSSRGGMAGAREGFVRQPTSDLEAYLCDTFKRLTGQSGPWRVTSATISAISGPDCAPSRRCRSTTSIGRNMTAQHPFCDVECGATALQGCAEAVHKHH
jgi:hypothetical protein